ncbi:MAG: KOW domain-containing RNA-binding protein [Lachnospiraceae bacterium]
MEYKIGSFARSLAGHDKGNLFVIVKENGEYVILVDGKSRTLEKPKYKKKKHVQLVYSKDETLSRKLSGEEPITDGEIRSLIRNCKRENQVI